MSTVFISYASQDRARAHAVAAALEVHGYQVWWDRTIPPGRVFDEVIQEALQAARCVVVLWSSDSVRSNWVKVEAEEAATRGVLVPALIENVTPPIQFKRIQAANLTDWNGADSHPEFRNLVSAIDRMLGQPPAASAPRAGRRRGSAAAMQTVRTVAWSVGTTLAVVAAVWLLSRTATDETRSGSDARTGQAAGGDGARVDSASASSGPTASSADDRQTSGTTRDLPAQGGELLNLLSSQNGGELITAEDPGWARTIDGDESTLLWVHPSIRSSEAVFAFTDGRAATIEAVEILVAGANPENVSEFEVLTGTDGPDGRFEPLQVFRPKNLLIVKERYQRFTFPPRAARYVKARVLKSHGGVARALAEWRVLGRLP